jgi:hypothetical protein
MNDHPVTAPAYISLKELANDYVYRFHHKTFPLLSMRRSDWPDASARRK